MSVAEFLSELRRRDVEVAIDGDELRCSARAGALTPELLDRLKERKTDILDFLRQAKTLAAQARAIVPLQSRGTGVPVFAVPGHNGDVFCYRLFARHCPEAPFFGLQPPGLDGRDRPLTRLEDLAGYFAAQIRAAHPGGPVIIAGFCAGGVVAFELARQLESAGTPVRFLALFGSPYPTFFRPLRRTWNGLGGHVRKLVARSSGGSLAYLAERVRERKLRRDDPLLALRVEVERATIAAVRGYTPGHFPGRLCLFLPTNAWARTRFGAPLWRRVARTCEEYPGPDGCGADDLLIEPHAGALAALFRQCRGEGELS